MHGFRKILECVDRAIYQVERVLLLFSVFMMTALVFSDVVQRTFSRPVGKTAAILVFLVELFGPLTDAAKNSIEQTSGPATFVLAAALIFIAGAHAGRSGNRERQGLAPPSFLSSAGIGLAVFVAAAASVKILLVVAPSGIPGAQKIALGFLVWSGFLGASLATRSRRHIVLDAVKKKFDPDTGAVVSVVGGTITGAFCLFLGSMALHKTTTMITEWAESGGRIHRFESVPIPEWLVVGALPITLTLIGVRYFSQGLAEFLYGASLVEAEDEHGINLKALAGTAEKSTVSDDVPALGRPHPTRGGVS